MTIKRSVGTLLILIGIFIIIIQPLTSVTGAVIDISTAVSRVWFFIGLGFILGGIFLVVTAIKENPLEKLLSNMKKIPGDEKKPYEKSIKRQIKRTDKLKYIPESVQDAVRTGISPKDAKKIYNESNKKVETGKWIDLGYETVRDTNNQKKWPDATSLCRYWGPEEYSGSSKNKLKKLYRKGELGKTHELVRGSDIYKEGGKLSEGTISKPPKGSRVLHRHWEIKQMYDRKK